MEPDQFSSLDDIHPEGKKIAIAEGKTEAVLDRLDANKRRMALQAYDTLGRIESTRQQKRATAEIRARAELALGQRRVLNEIFPDKPW